jgi:hypothetical protein
LSKIATPPFKFLFEGGNLFFLWFQFCLAFCLLILPAYLPLKSPNGQFPLKISGPIGQATLEQNKKKQKKIHPWWGLHVGGKGVLL